MQIRERLNSSKEAARVYHVGSTAVNDFIAKPIIDILMEYESVTDMGNIIGSLEELGYRHKGENGITGREYFIKGTDGITYFHLHAFARGTREAVNHKKVVTTLEHNPSHKRKYREYKETNVPE